MGLPKFVDVLFHEHWVSEIVQLRKLIETPMVQVNFNFLQPRFHSKLSGWDFIRTKVPTAFWDFSPVHLGREQRALVLRFCKGACCQMVLDKEEKGHLAISSWIVLSDFFQLMFPRFSCSRTPNFTSHWSLFPIAQERVKLKQWAVEHVDRFLGTLLASFRDFEHSMIPLIPLVRCMWRQLDSKTFL